MKVSFVFCVLFLFCLVNVLNSFPINEKYKGKRMEFKGNSGHQAPYNQILKELDKRKDLSNEPTVPPTRNELPLDSLGFFPFG